MSVFIWLGLTVLNEISPPSSSQILPDFKPCHTLPLMSRAPSEAAVTFWSLRFSILFSTGALQQNNLMLVAPAIDISNSGFRSYFAGSGYPFLPIATECQPFGAGSNIYEGLIHRPSSSLEQDALQIVSRGALGLSESFMLVRGGISGRKEVSFFDGRFLSDEAVGEVKRLSTRFCHVKQLCMENTLDACLTRLPQS